MTQKRPYRIKRKQEIQFRKAFWRFLMLFSLVLCLGFFSRFLIQSIPLQEKITELIQSPQGYSVDFKGAEFQFHSGLMPVVAVHVPRITVNDTSCVSNSIRVHNFLMIFDFFKLLQGQIRPSRVLVNYLEGNHYQVCSNETPSSTSESDGEHLVEENSVKKTSTPVQVVKKLSTKSFQNFYNNVWPDIVSFSVQSVSVEEFSWNEYLKLNEKLHLAGKLKLKKKKTVIGDFDLTQLSLRNEKMDSFSSRGQFEISEEGLKVSLKNKVREGDLVFSVDLKREKNWPVVIQFDLKRLPISALSSFLKEDIRVSYLWASCQFDIQSSWKELMDQDINLKNCELSGPYGEVRVKSLIANLQSIKEYEVEVSKLKLDEVVKEKRDLYFSGVLAEYGTVSAQIKYKNREHVVKGYVENSQFLFSHSNLRDVQKVKKIPFEAEGRLDDWKVSVQNVVLDEGEFDGDIQVVSSRSKQAEGKIAIHRLVLNHKIYKLMLKSEPAELRVYGKFVLDEGKISQWSAILATPELKSEKYSLKNLKVKGEMTEEDVSRVNINVSQGSINKATLFFDWVRPTHLDSEWKSDVLDFQELSAQLDLFSDQKVAWHRGYVRLKNGWQLSSEGARYPNRQVVAWLQWDRPSDGRYMKWNFKGPFFKGEWYPKTTWVREWLETHPNFLKENGSISLKPFDEDFIPKSSFNLPENNIIKKKGV